MQRQRVWQVEGRLARFHGVYHIFFDFSDFGVAEIAVEKIYFGRAYDGSFRLRDDLYALRRGIGPLIELTGQVLHRESDGSVGIRCMGHNIRLRFGEDRFLRVGKEVFGDVFDIITVQDSDFFQRADAEKGFGFVKKSVGLMRQFRPFFNKYSVNHVYPP